MGFGFNFFFILVLVPVTIILLVLLVLFRNKIFGILLVGVWVGVFGIIALSLAVEAVFSKKVLDKEDYYGEYIIDRSFFSGRQADWQYNHFRFKVTEQDSILLYETNGEKIIRTYKGSITTVTPHHSARLVINMEQPTHHILASNPTTHRETWRFYLTLESPKFGNMFFKKGKWEPID